MKYHSSSTLRPRDLLRPKLKSSEIRLRVPEQQMEAVP